MNLDRLVASQETGAAPVSPEQTSVQAPDQQKPPMVESAVEASRSASELEQVEGINAEIAKLLKRPS